MSLGWLVLMAFMRRLTAWGPIPGGMGPAPGAPGAPGAPVGKMEFWLETI